MVSGERGTLEDLRASVRPVDKRNRTISDIGKTLEILENLSIWDLALSGVKGFSEYCKNELFAKQTV